jgi:rubrerythrin
MARRRSRVALAFGPGSSPGTVSPEREQTPIGLGHGPKEKTTMTKSIQHLNEAFAGESQANRKYTAFARKAAAEGYPQIAKLFRAAAEAETVHALAHLRALKGVGTTVENLKTAIAGEGYEYREMYPAFIADAEAEKAAAALISFKNAMAVEKIHHGLYSEALAAAKAGRDLPANKIYVCEVCGNTVVGKLTDKCSVCGAGQDKFTEVR